MRREIKKIDCRHGGNVFHRQPFHANFFYHAEHLCCSTPLLADRSILWVLPPSRRGERRSFRRQQLRRSPPRPLVGSICSSYILHGIVWSRRGYTPTDCAPREGLRISFRFRVGTFRSESPSSRFQGGVFLSRRSTTVRIVWKRKNE